MPYLCRHWDWTSGFVPWHDYYDGFPPPQRVINQTDNARIWLIARQDIFAIMLRRLNDDDGVDDGDDDDRISPQSIPKGKVLIVSIFKKRCGLWLCGVLSCIFKSSAQLVYLLVNALKHREVLI